MEGSCRRHGHSVVSREPIALHVANQSSIASRYNDDNDDEKLQTNDDSES